MVDGLLEQLEMEVNSSVQYCRSRKSAVEYSFVEALSLFIVSSLTQQAVVGALIASTNGFTPNDSNDDISFSLGRLSLLYLQLQRVLSLPLSVVVSVPIQLACLHLGAIPNDTIATHRQKMPPWRRHAVEAQVRALPARGRRQE